MIEINRRRPRPQSTAGFYLILRRVVGGLTKVRVMVRVPMSENQHDCVTEYKQIR